MNMKTRLSTINMEVTIIFILNFYVHVIIIFTVVVIAVVVVVAAVIVVVAVGSGCSIVDITIIII